MTMSRNDDLNLALSAQAAPDFASACFAETEHAMPLKENADARGTIRRMTARLTLLGLLVMGTAIRTRVTNAETIEIERAVSDYIPAADIQMQRSAMEGSADPASHPSAYAGTDQILLSFLSKSSFAREKILELVIDQYISSSSRSDSLTDDLDSAIDAIESLETDGEPIQVKGHPFLFVGSVGASLNHEALRENGITHVINWSPSAKCNTFDDMEYMCISGVRGDHSMRGQLAKLDKAVELIESARKAGGRVLSHCWHGRNRSVTLLVAYLMKYEGMSAAQANYLIKKTRPQAAPYFGVLRAYSTHYLITHTENATGKKQLKPKITLEKEAN